MILHALAQRYNDTAGTDNAVPFGWAMRDAAYALDLDEQGRLHGILTLWTLEGKRKIRPQFLLPIEPTGRTSAIKPAFLCDNSKYFFGLSANGDSREKKCHDASRALHEKLLASVNHPIVYGILRFFENWKQDEALNHPIIAHILSDKKSSKEFYEARFVIQVNGRFVHDEPLVRQVWNEAQVGAAGEQIRCLITGEMDTLAKLHGKISLPGVTMGSVPLVSINAESFASYGKGKDDPAAQIGEKAAFAYTTALNTLINDRNHRKRLGSDTLVYWADEGGEEEAYTFSLIGDPKEEDNQKLDGIMKKLYTGERLSIDGCVMEKPFCILCMSPNAGRISVRFFYRSTFGDVITNSLNHYSNMEVAMSQNERFLYLPPWILLSETTIKKQASDAAPLLSGQLMYSIVSGRAYPMTLYIAVIKRIHAGERVNRVKASIIKAVLLRNYPESEVITVSLNDSSNNIPYNLGRLFSVLERIQQKSANEQLNTTVRDRYFSSACANPGSVFPILLKLSIHHVAKLENPVFFEKLKGELLNRLDSEVPFPAAMNLEEQGRFIIGYYHQNQDFFTSKKDKEDVGNV